MIESIQVQNYYNAAKNSFVQVQNQYNAEKNSSVQVFSHIQFNINPSVKRTTNSKEKKKPQSTNLCYNAELCISESLQCRIVITYNAAELLKQQ